MLGTACALAICPVPDARASDRPAAVVVAVAPGPGADAAYGQVLRDALAVSLARNRMKPTTAETFDEARASAARDRIDYLVLGTWTNTAETLELSVEVWLPGGSSPLAAAKASGRIGLTMDAVAGEAMEGVLTSMRSRFPADAEAATAATAGAEAAGAATAASATGAAAAAAGSGADAAAEGAGGATAAETPARWRRVELSVGVAPLVATGMVADYAKIGAFADAERLFRRVLERLPADEHALRFLAETERLKKSPPAPGWTGVVEMTEK